MKRERTHQHMTRRSKSIDNTLIVFRLEGFFFQILPKTVGILISIPATRLERVSNTNVRDTKLLSYYPSISFLRSIESSLMAFHECFHCSNKKKEIDSTANNLLLGNSITVTVYKLLGLVLLLLNSKFLV